MVGVCALEEADPGEKDRESVCVCVGGEIKHSWSLFAAYTSEIVCVSHVTRKPVVFFFVSKMRRRVRQGLAENPRLEHV